MNVKLISKGVNENGNKNIHQTLLHQNAQQKSAVFHNISKPSPVLSDRSEFPSLSETSKNVTNNSSDERVVKYSDKLKSFSKNSDTVLENFHPKSGLTRNRYSGEDGRRSLNKRETASGKSRYLSANEANFSTNQTIPVKQFNQSSKKYSSSHEHLPYGDKNELSRKQHSNSLINSKCSASYKTKSNNQIQSDKSLKDVVGKNDSKTEKNNDVQSNSKEKKKKNRKSKVKRQIALQSGKITVLTPEVHLKILNQTSALSSTNSKTILTDINDEEEYPELGKSLFQTNQKVNLSKKDASEIPKETIDKPSSAISEDKPVTKDKESSVCNVIKTTPRLEKPVPERKGKNESKVTIHPNDPIKISFFDILLKNSKPREKDLKDEIDSSNKVGVTKMKMKKDVCQPHNLLDSSSPMIKRGKERENPKPKRPSQLKKIILLDRKARKEQLLLLKSNNLGNSANAGEILENTNTDELKDEADAVETNVSVKSNSEVSLNELKKNDEKHLLFSNNSLDEDSLKDELDTETLNKFSLNGMDDVPCSIVQEDVKSNESFDSLSLEDKISHNDNGVLSISTESVSSTEIFINAPHSSDSLLKNLIHNDMKSEILDKERAAKILLHTRNFREYCDHLISKDIDDAVFALLDDLARFQDRLHQKDPIKARMKRRMINGIKEVKKYIKLRKLKCIIIAVDIENVETQGGLNDALNQIKMSAVDHHIPCIFALGRKVLGKVCRKPVPISCVGIFNFEGSEANFKKLIELQTQSKADYNEIFSKLTLKLTDEETATLLKAKLEAPETLRTIRIDILNDFLMKSKTGENTNTCSNSLD